MTDVPLKEIDAVEQAVLYNSRERRRSLAGIPELFRTFAAPIPTLTLAAASMPDTDFVVTFWTAIRITGASPNGMILSLGNSTTALAAWVDDTTLTFRAGDEDADDSGTAEFDNTISLPIGLELDLVFAVRPGDGRVRIWGNGEEIARGVAANGSMPLGWSASVDGSFASEALESLTSDVGQTGDPSNFDVIQSLSVFSKQVPRHFI